MRGVYTALVTPFGPSGVDSEILERLVERQKKAGVSGIILAGSTGEGQTLTDAELQTLAKISQKFASQDFQILFACGLFGTLQTIEKAKKLIDLGAQALLINTPPYNKPPQRGLIAHFLKIADEVAVPIMVYNIPGRTAINLLPTSMAEIWKHPKILALKESSGDLKQIGEQIRICPHEKSVLSGDDPLNLDIFKLGGKGSVSVLSNLTPRLLQKLWSFHTQGESAQAQSLEAKMKKVYEPLFAESNPIPVKFLIGQILKKDLPPRLPLVELAENLRTSVKTAFAELLRLEEDC